MRIEPPGIAGRRNESLNRTNELRGGAVPLERPRPIAGACATRVRRRTGDLPGLR